MRKIRIRSVHKGKIERRQPVLRMRCCGGKFAVIQHTVLVGEYDPILEEYVEKNYIGLHLYEVKSGALVMVSMSMESLLQRFDWICMDKREFKDRLRNAIKNYAVSATARSIQIHTLKK